MKKLLDILFEDEEEIISEAPITNLNEKPRPVNQKAEALKAPKAPESKDVLTKRPQHSQSFGIINVAELQVKKNPSTPKVVVQETEYEAQPPMSPIFGILKANQDNVLKTPQIKSGGISSLGTVLSPIYGLDIQNNTPEEPLIVNEEPSSADEPFDEPYRADIKINEIHYDDDETEEESHKADEFDEESVEEFTYPDENNDVFMNATLDDMLEKPSEDDVESSVDDFSIPLFDTLNRKEFK